MRKSIVLIALCLFTSTLVLAHEGHAHKLLGTVKSLKANSLELTLKDGKTKTVTLTDKTEIFKGDDKAGRAALVEGVRVAVEVDEDDKVLTVKVAAAEEHGTTTGRVSDSRSLAAHLRASGLRVEAVEEIKQPFFTPKAKVIRIGDSGEAQVYEYASEEKAASEVARVNADGSIGTSMPMWIAPPHYFRKGSLLVLYLGTDEKTLQALRGALGDQFAGRKAN